MLTEKDYCDYDTCVALEELGYPRYHYDNGGELDKILRMVTLYNAQKFLREEKGIIVDVFVDDDSDTPITYNIYKDGKCVCHHHGKYWSVKEWSKALLEGINEAIKWLKECENTED